MTIARPQRGDTVDQVEGRADRSLRVVFMRRGCSPDSDHGIPDELIDRPAVAGDDLACGIEVSCEKFPHLFGIPAIRQAGETDQVGEQNRNQPALGGRNDDLAGEHGFSERGAALTAKPLARLVCRSAGGTRDRQARGALGTELASRPVLGAASRADQHGHPSHGLGRAYPKRSLGCRPRPPICSR